MDSTHDPDNNNAGSGTQQKYNTKLLKEFIERVFHAEFDPDEEVITWRCAPGTRPGYPVTDSELITGLNSNRSRVTSALYFGTSTVRADENGKYRNRADSFVSLRVLVLDDIGTKGQKLPDAFTPTYVIETSPGNYQYGYVLAEPITDYDKASALVSVTYTAGYSDSGGKMPTKIVRLPDGVNGKDSKNKKDFKVRLVHFDGPLWTPQEILDYLSPGAKWEKLTEAKSRLRLAVDNGQPPADHYSDPVAQWLRENNLIISVRDDWLNVACPNHEAHTDGDITAGYRPIGRGAEPDTRAFHCFHDHCTHIETVDYLRWVAKQGGPFVDVREGDDDEDDDTPKDRTQHRDHPRIASRMADYVYDITGDCIWHLGAPHSKPIALSRAAFKSLYPHSVKVTGSDGKVKQVTEYKLWELSPNRITVRGCVNDPTIPAKLVDRPDGQYVNLYHAPDWVEETDDKHIKIFSDYLKYLIPNKDDRKYFLDWLSAKVNSIAFRGPAVVMISQAQGIGRNTLSDMLAMLFGQNNVANIPFHRLLSDTSFNDYLEKPLVVCDETLSVGESNYYKVYETLKDLIDPRPKTITVNPKYGKHRQSKTCSSFLFFSNHIEALAGADSDRRFYVIENPSIPAPPAYFVEINAWMGNTSDNTPAWCPSVWHWLKNREYDLDALNAPPKLTEAKQQMLDATRSPIDTMVMVLLRCWPSPHISTHAALAAIRRYEMRLNLTRIDWEAVARRLVRKASKPYPADLVINVNGTPVRPRVLLDRLREPKSGAVPPNKLTDAARERIAADLRKAVEPDTENRLHTDIDEELSKLDY